jgi:hypothetical protein
MDNKNNSKNVVKSSNGVKPNKSYPALPQGRFLPVKSKPITTQSNYVNKSNTKTVKTYNILDKPAKALTTDKLIVGPAKPLSVIVSQHVNHKIEEKQKESTEINESDENDKDGGENSHKKKRKKKFLFISLFALFIIWLVFRKK